MRLAEFPPASLILHHLLADLQSTRKKSKCPTVHRIIYTYILFHANKN